MTGPEAVAYSVVAREQARVTQEKSEMLRAAVANSVHEPEALIHQIETLTQALETRTQIATAVGMLMALQKVSNEEAFAILRRASQRTNRKLREIAIEMLESHHQRLEPPAEQLRANA